MKCCGYKDEEDTELPLVEGAAVRKGRVGWD